ncbi:2-dehydro-3-deoxygluconokinase [Kineosphaera limosa]|uniref:Putative carbohydrate kinase n=1 Tax=Kineosphaera limosa NBRC 100340 TaxID=1184609 RepID=K6WQM3_9MICO|nr:sugar kinase [Kineosphaera limosa]NYE01915.1 2-dehydro-3-deoxygluconokinase [Kineosphaera limosa]GAB96141.1 putative carbohydrate kinase [Kineosphaera limosa NBRC 100340]
MTSQSVDVACLGETMLLLVPDPPRPPETAEVFRREIGGAESNVAIGLRRLGASTTWHSALGDDAFGDYVLDRVAGQGVRCVVRRDPDRPTGLYVKELRPEGTSVRYYRSGSAAASLEERDIAAILEQHPRWIHTTGITPALSQQNASVVELLWRSAPEGTRLSLDINFRAALHHRGSPEMLLDLANRADVVFCGEDEAAALWGHRGPEEVRAAIHGPTTLVVKQGARGALAFGIDGRSCHPAPTVEVVEPVGAGDAFAAGFLSRHIEGGSDAECLALSTACAGAALGVRGDLPDRASGVELVSPRRD